MAVALTGVVIALGGTALAAGGALENDGPTVQACVTNGNILRDVTGSIYDVSGDVVTPAAQADDGEVVEKVLTPKGTVLAVPPGEKCSVGSSSQRLAAASVTAASGKEMTLGADNTTLASIQTRGGTMVIDATVQLAMHGESRVDHTASCALTGPDGKPIPGTLSQATIHAHQPGDRLALPINAVVTTAAGTISGVCNDSAGARAARAGSRSGRLGASLRMYGVLTGAA